ncbi:MAG: integrase family protein [Proteobacteria bacterium]|nr:integrase family protein [Candidatus Enterousia onthequi]
MAHQFFFNPYILDNLPLPEKGFDVVQDISEPRLRMYVTSRGAKTFFVRRRVRGRDQRIIIGAYPDMDIETARDRVATVLADSMKKMPVRRKKISFHDFWTLYLKHKVRRCEDSEVKLVRAVNMHLADLFDKNISEISENDIKNVIAKISGAAVAGRMQEVLASVFKYAIEQGYAKNNPVENLPKIQQVRRQSPLDDESFLRLIDVIRDVDDVVMRSAFLMLIYAFLPKSKVLSMRWDDLDFNHYMWRDWPLSNVAVVLLENMAQDGDWVFMGRCKNHLADPRVAWRNVANAAGMPNLRMDDVYKFLMRRLKWAADREDLRENMNKLLEKYSIY